MRNAEYDLCAAAGAALHGKSVVGAIVKPDAVIDILHGVAAVRGLYRVAEKLCDNVAIIKGGRLIRSGTMDEVKGDDSLEDVFLELEEKDA